MVFQITETKIDFLISSIVTTGKSFGKKTYNQTHHTFHKTKFQMNQRLNVKNETMHVLEEIMGEFLFNPGVIRKDF